MSCQRVRLFSWPNFKQGKHDEHTSALCLERLTMFFCLGRRHVTSLSLTQTFV